MHYEIESMTVAEIKQVIEASETNETKLQADLYDQRQYTRELRNYLKQRLALAEPDGHEAPTLKYLNVHIAGRRFDVSVFDRAPRTGECGWSIPIDANIDTICDEIETEDNWSDDNGSMSFGWDAQTDNMPHRDESDGTRNVTVRSALAKESNR